MNSKLSCCICCIMIALNIGKIRKVDTTVYSTCRSDFLEIAIKIQRDVSTIRYRVSIRQVQVIRSITVTIIWSRAVRYRYLTIGDVHYVFPFEGFHNVRCSLKHDIQFEAFVFSRLLGIYNTVNSDFLVCVRNKGLRNPKAINLYLRMVDLSV